MQGCESVKLLHKSWFSEETDPEGDPVVTSRYYPPSTFRKEPHWVSSLDSAWHITKLLREIYQAMQNNAPSLSAMGIRAAIEAILIDKVKDQGSFARNLKSFQESGFISTAELDALDVALELGHATIHRAHLPSSDHLENALDILENLMHRLYVLAPKAKASARAIPKRTSR